ncbi:MAG: DUF4870 domain-containing protein [Mesonia hippocampi]|uniref:DUF4870 domain-containing protein n=1 Tax=Mesonia hippocampi TaxID=1628250 RepID=UPI003F9ACFB8
MKKQDTQMLSILHYSQLLNLFTLVGGLIVPIILWQVKKDEIDNMDAHGKAVVNFQLSLLLYGVIGSLTMIILVGFLILLAVAVLGTVFPIINGIKASKGEALMKYPLSITFIK